jgi:hypothetical protein
MTVDVSAPVVRALKERLASLSLLFLGQHLWTLRITQPEGGESIACICRCCEEARKSYRVATGAWPTTDEEHRAMRAWGAGM